MGKNEIVLFSDGEKNIEVQVSPDQDTVWLTQKKMGELFDVKQATLSEHISNILNTGELDETSKMKMCRIIGGNGPLTPSPRFILKSLRQQAG